MSVPQKEWQMQYIMHICIDDYQFALVILVMFIVSIHLSHDLINHYQQRNFL